MKTNQSPFNFKTFFFVKDPQATDEWKWAIQNAQSSRNLSDGISGDTNDPKKFRWNLKYRQPSLGLVINQFS